MNYDELQPGRELDELIARKVMAVGGIMGHPIIVDGSIAPEAPQLMKVPPYSTDISAAWFVVERFAGPPDFGYLFCDLNLFVWNSKTAAYKICVAALKKVGYK